MLYTEQEFADPEFPFKVEIKQGLEVANKLHAHSFFQISYIMKGTCLHRVNGREAVLAKGDLISIPPMSQHQLELLPDKDVELVQIDFMPALLDGSIQSYGDLTHFVHVAFIRPFLDMNDRLLPQLTLTYEGQQRVESIITEIRMELDRREAGYPLVIKAAVQRLLVLTGREYASYADAKQGTGGAAAASRKFFEEAVAYIHSRFREEIKLQDAAARATMSPAYFSTMFKLFKGKSFVEYVNELRLGEAMRLLKETDMGVDGIALETGFNNSTHFYRMFKKTTGLTPAAYRRKG
ncbi:AraC family transcriptional regulator [Paenibacillus koleovorans]|uniref:AraC family transcriptional regulator n=1 Tax=Paenibacillus koleovorans TaxID=121608 RepID=UPI0013E2A18F|nr:AraC family transcriptional regulator [Paenibacillus koleovorans]